METFYGEMTLYQYRVMAKITAYIDEEIWREFKRSVIERTNDTRAISRELEKLVESFLPERCARRALGELDLVPALLPTVQDVKQVIPKRRTSAGKTVRKMRDGRLASVSR